MRFFTALFSAVAAASLVSAAALPGHPRALTKRADMKWCNYGPGNGWANPVTMVGGSGSGYNTECETQYGGDFTPVQKIEVWRKSDSTGGRIAGIQFTYASGSAGPIYGQEDTASYPSTVLTLAPGELITNGVLYGDGVGAYLGHIHLETSKGQTFDAGRDTSSITPFGIANVGGGMLMGAYVTPYPSDETSGDDVGSLGFLFLGDAIDHIGLSDVTFTANPNGTADGINPSNVVVGQWYNGANESATFSLTPTYGVTQSYSYSQTTTNTWGVSESWEVEGSFFGIVSGKETTQFNWNIQKASGTTTATTSSTVVACGATGTLAPGKGVKVTGTYQTGSNQFTYDSTVTVYLKDGSKYWYTESGTLNNVAYDSCYTSLVEMDDPSNANSPGMSPLMNAAEAQPTAGASSASSASASASGSGSSTASSKPSAATPLSSSSTLEPSASSAVKTKVASQLTMTAKAAVGTSTGAA